MRISDWSSDVCSSDLTGFAGPDQIGNQLKIATFLGLFGISQAIVMIAGGQGLDLSVGAVATLGGIVGAAVLDVGASGLLLSIALAGLCGFLVGEQIGIASCRERGFQCV